ncbi:MAG: Rab family GTPase [Bacteroidia bacterium]|nr:Rab family GTPase [Bacteroidia bacterium]
MDSTNWISKKIALLGYHAVGKTSLISQFVEQKFPESYLSTIGLKVDKKTVELGDHRLELIIWDIAGQENMAHIPQYYLNGCGGFIYVIDVSRPSTYEDLKTKLHMIQSMVPGAEMVIAANKKDLLSASELEEVLASCEIRPDISTSAKENDNVEDLFNMLASKLLAAHES